MQVDKGRMRPIAKTKLEVFLTDAEKIEFVSEYLLQKLKANKENYFITNAKHMACMVILYTKL